ncbi:lipid A biosynthesis lauroyl acyltransferase [Candidatus Hepatincolaceae symbiont of Richtersius coronifer]
MIKINKKIFKNLSEYILAVAAYGLYYFIYYLVPLKVSSAIGGFLGRTFLYYFPFQRKYEVLKNIKFCFPKKSDKEIKEIYKDACDNFLRVIFELPKINIIYSTNAIKILDPYNYIEQSREKKMLFFTAHIGNWELIGFPFIFKPYTDAVYKAPANHSLENLFLNVRTKNVKGSLHQMFTLNTKTLKLLNQRLKNYPLTIIMLVDQRIKEGLAVSFFDRIALTSPFLPLLALKYNIPLIPIRVIRDKDGGFTLTVEKELTHVKTANNQQDISNLTQAMNDKIQEWVTQHPKQWFWLHRRW